MVEPQKNGTKRPITPINDAFMRLQKRAETIDLNSLVDTFVDVGPLFPLLQSRDHQIVYGRRGTGKTHALQYLLANRSSEGDAAVYIDMRNIGSTAGLYGDSTVSLTERGSRLLVDTITAIYDRLVEDALEAIYGDKGGDALSLLDDLADEITRVRVVGGEVERTATIGEEHGTEKGGNAAIEAGTMGIAVRLGASEKEREKDRSEIVMRETGQLRHSVHFGDISRLLRRIVERLTDGGRLWTGV